MKKNSCYWYCPKCKEELDGCHVTYQELCEYCGTAVLSVPESISQETIKEIIKAKAEGRLVELPCKVGDTVWKIKSVFSYFSKPMEDRVDRIIISNNEILACCTSGTKFLIGIIGKTVFLTREEAEKALEGSK